MYICEVIMGEGSGRRLWPLYTLMARMTPIVSQTPSRVYESAEGSGALILDKYPRTKLS
jgi:hypothetical protein